MTHTDIQKLHWIERFVPKSFLPYAYLARLDRPIGIWLLLLPSLWAIFLSAGGATGLNWTIVKIIALFCVGSIVMRAAGCVVNDLWDRDFDSKVERTRTRPLASGAISPKQAFVFLTVLLGIGALILFQLSIVSILLGFLVLPLIGLYPLMKRLTWWPQAFLGITFNFGVLIGWSAVTGVLSLPALFLYVAAIYWTLGYDTIYALQDKDDDGLIGIKSLALKLGDKVKDWIAIFYAVSFVFMVLAFFLSGAGLISYAILVLAAIHLFWQTKKLRLDDPLLALTIFKSNRAFGVLVALAALLSF